MSFTTLKLNTINVQQEEHFQNLWLEIVTTLYNRIEESGIQLHGNISEILEQLFTPNVNPNNVLDVLLKLATASHLVPDNDILDAQITQLPRPAVGVVYQNNFYVRSIPFNTDQLSQVITHYERHTYDILFVEAIQNEINNLKSMTIDKNPDQLINNNQNNIIYIRYIGVTTGITTNRFAEDASNAHGSRFSNFCTSVRAILGDTFLTSYGKTYDFSSLSLDRLSTLHQEQSKLSLDALVDSIEQILIHLFDRKLLLNSQPGGYYFRYSLNHADLQLLRSLNLQPISLVRSDSAIIKNQKRNISKLYFGFLQGIFGQHNVPQHLAELYINFYVNQIVIRNISHMGCIPLVVMGSNITQEDYTMRRNYIGSNSRAGTLFTELFQMATTAQQITDVHDHLDNNIPFMDFHPTLNEDNYHLHATFAARVLEEVNASIVLTLGFIPTAAALSNFHTNALSRLEYGDVIGVPHIVNIDAGFNYEDTHNEPRDKHVIILPCYHPGMFGHRSKNPKFCQLLLYILAAAQKLKSMAIETMNYFVSQGLGSPFLTRTLCEMVIQKWNSYIQSNGEFYQKIIELRDSIKNEIVMDAKGSYEVSLIRGTRTKTTPSTGPNLIVSQASRERLIERSRIIGKTKGPPFSETRRQQAIILRRYRHPSVRCHPYYNTEADWMIWFMSLREDGSILHFTTQFIQISREGRPDDSIQTKRLRNFTKRLFAIPPPDWPTNDDSWVDDPILLHEAKIRKYQVFKNNQVIREANRAKMVAYMQTLPATDYFVEVPVRLSNGKTRVGVRINGVRCTEPEGIYWTASQAVEQKTSYLIDYNPEKYHTVDLVLVHDNGQKNPVKINNNLVTVSGKKLYETAPTTYFVTYAATVHLFGDEMSPELEEELRKLEGGQLKKRKLGEEAPKKSPKKTFHPEHVLKILWKEHAGERLYTHSRVKEGMTALLPLLLEIIDRPEISTVERNIWLERYEKGAKEFNLWLLRQFKAMFSDYPEYKVERFQWGSRPQINGRQITLPPYID